LIAVSIVSVPLLQKKTRDSASCVCFTSFSATKPESSEQSIRTRFG
jgi:hypothetical protein